MSLLATLALSLVAWTVVLGGVVLLLARVEYVARYDEAVRLRRRINHRRHVRHCHARIARQCWCEPS